jgi:hypothetical protein
MSGTEQNILRTKQAWRAVVIAAAAAAVTLGTVGSAVAAQRTTAVASPAATRGSGGRAGWAPVPYRDAQLSVPGSWQVEGPEQLSCAFPQSAGMIFTGQRPALPKDLGCRLTASLAWIVPAGQIGPGIRHRRPTAVINGTPVYRLHSATGSVVYLVPALGVRVGARGPEARRVLATLTRSPLSDVLSRGPASTVPASWIWRQFGGVRFATPRSWGPLRATQWATCGTGQLSRTLLLIDATRPPLALPCPLQIPSASAERAQPGLTVVTGKYAARSVGQQYPSCRVRHGAQICFSSVTGEGGAFSGVLIFSVSRPHRHATTFFLLGLAGSGTNARRVLGSIRMAGS